MERKGKEEYLYSAFSHQGTYKALRHGSHSFTCKQHHAPIHQKCPFPWGIWTSHVTHDALGPCEPTTQTAPRYIQPCFYRWPRTVTVLYNGLPVYPSKLPLPMLASGPHVIPGSLGLPESGMQMATWSFQPFLQSSLVWQTDRATDRPTDHATQCDVE